MSNEPQTQEPQDEAKAFEGAETLVAALEAELAKARDELLRSLAEADNIRKRAARETQDARAYAIDRFARDLLPVADSLARALSALSPQAQESLDGATRTLLDGVAMTERALNETFARNGLMRVGAKGDAFDPNLHQAVAQAPSEAPANTVAEVMQAGYTLGERTLRPAMVVVSTGPAAVAPEPTPSPSTGIDIKV